ncbi:MAG: PqqD family protein [Clostridia bacterium]|nr:PqqD family protein [Clostridia bacterium]
MKIKSDFILRKMDDMCIVVAVGESAKTFNGVINLNSTAVFMWEKLSAGCTRQELIDALTGEYDVQEEVVERDVDKLIDKLRAENIIDE